LHFRSSKTFQAGKVLQSACYGVDTELKISARGFSGTAWHIAQGLIVIWGDLHGLASSAMLQYFMFDVHGELLPAHSFAGAR